MNKSSKLKYTKGGYDPASPLAMTYTKNQAIELLLKNFEEELRQETYDELIDIILASYKVDLKYMDSETLKTQILVSLDQTIKIKK